MLEKLNRNVYPMFSILCYCQLCLHQKVILLSCFRVKSWSSRKTSALPQAVSYHEHKVHSAPYSQPLTTALASCAFTVCCGGIFLALAVHKPQTKQENLGHCAAASDEHPSAQHVLLPRSQTQLLTFTDSVCYWNIGCRALFTRKRWKVYYILWLLNSEL